MKLVLTATRWGVTYRLRHFIDGKPVSKATFNETWSQKGCTPENGTMEDTPSGFRKTWEV